MFGKTPIKTPWLFVGVLFLLLVGPIAGFYIRYELISNSLKEEKGYTGATANAIKHAYAAAELYKFLNSFLNQGNAEKIVLRLGALNERVERITKFHKPDSYAEILKDFHNNLAGLTVVQWQSRMGNKEDTSAILVKLAGDHILVTRREQNQFFADGKTPKDGSIDAAEIWLDQYKNRIQNNVYSALKRLNRKL